MLVTDVGDEMCWRQFLDVGDAFGYFGHQHALSLNISVGHQDRNSVANIKIVINFKSPTSQFHQHDCSRKHHIQFKDLRPFLFGLELIENKLSGIFIRNNFEITISSVFWISSQSLWVSVPLYFDYHGFINLDSNLWGPRCVKIYQKNETWLSRTKVGQWQLNAVRLP